MLDNVLLENLLNSEPRCTIRFLAVEFTLLTPLKPIFSDYFTVARLRFRERILRERTLIMNEIFGPFFTPPLSPCVRILTAIALPPL